MAGSSAESIRVASQMLRTHAEDVSLWAERLGAMNMYAPDRQPDRNFAQPPRTAGNRNADIDPMDPLAAVPYSPYQRHPDPRIQFRATRAAQAARWRWDERPHTVTAEVGDSGEITMSIASIARDYGAESARIAVRQAEQARQSGIDVEMRDFFQRRQAHHAQEREYREFVRSVSRRRRFWQGFVAVTKKAWAG